MANEIKKKYLKKGLSQVQHGTDITGISTTYRKMSFLQIVVHLLHFKPFMLLMYYVLYKYKRY